jgi:hypothetical protein
MFNKKKKELKQIDKCTARLILTAKLCKIIKRFFILHGNLNYIKKRVF